MTPPMTAEALRALAREVEGPFGAGRSVNEKIGAAVGLNINPKHIHGGAPGYTRSIDAAMAMKPLRWRLAALREEPADVGGWHATGFRSPPGNALESGTARTAALALTACWLRAIAADIEAKEPDHV